jgi:hypothetical protein
VPTRLAELPIIPWARPFARSLVASTGPAPESSVTLQWATPALIDRQFVELEKKHTKPPSRMSTEIPVPAGRSSTLALRLPPGPDYQWRVITLREGVRRTSDWSQLYRPE